MQNRYGQWKEVFQTEPVAVHSLWKGWRRLKDIGKLTVYQKNDGTFWKSINHGFTYELVKDQVFYKLVYENFTSYLKQSVRGGFVALSFENSSPDLNSWETLLRKFGTIENFGKALETPIMRKKIEYHCPDVQKTSIHEDTMLTPLFKMGGRVQDTLMQKTQEMFAGGSSQEGYAQKTKRWIRNGWRAFTTKMHEAKQVISDKMQGTSNHEVLVEEGANLSSIRYGKNNRVGITA